MIQIALWMNVLLSLFELFGAPEASAKSFGPSFDCNRARYQDEFTICNDQKLSELDQIASRGYSQVKGESRSIAQDFLLSSLHARHACWSNKLCILDTQAQIIDDLNEVAASIFKPSWIGAYRLSLIENGKTPMVSGVPERVGTCSQTKIKDIGTRFHDRQMVVPPKSYTENEGTTVQYDNGGFQVSYEFNADVAASRIGDQVIFCLVSIPQNCPPGDDRGKIYSATNLRNQNYGSCQQPSIRVWGPNGRNRVS
ncbi:MAG: hypothetical protein CMP95_02960 [Gammaproteobacteria bacterium]|nr:hypothetical protein [Gammaproteobacteria bacterium]